MANQVDDRSRAIGGMHARPAAWFIRGLWFVVRLQVVLVALAVMLEGLARSATSSLRRAGETPQEVDSPWLR